MSTATNTAAAADQLDDGMTIDGTVTEVKAPDNALVILNPQQFATELFQPFLDQLASAKRKAAREKYDITTKDGLAKAKEFKATFVTIRTTADKTKAAAKRPIDESGKKILEHFNKLAEAAKVEEAKHAAAIEAEEKRQADERQRKQDEERQRVEALEAKVETIRLFPTTLAGATSDQLRTAIAEWSDKSLTKADYQDYFEDGVIALENTVAALRRMLDAAVQREETARKAEADRLELERLRTEQAERDRKAADDKRIADEAAAESARQLADAQAAAARSQRIMNDIQAIQQMATFDGDARALDDKIARVEVIEATEDQFGGMASVAQMAKDMAIGALKQRYQARLALELDQAHTEALDEDAQRADLAAKSARLDELVAPAVDVNLPIVVEPAPRRTFSGFGMGVRTPAAPIAPAPVQPVKPTAGEIIEALCVRFEANEETVTGWLVDLVKDLAL